MLLPAGLMPWTAVSLVSVYQVEGPYTAIGMIFIAMTGIFSVQSALRVIDKQVPQNMERLFCRREKESPWESKTSAGFHNAGDLYIPINRLTNPLLSEVRFLIQLRAGEIVVEQRHRAP